ASIVTALKKLCGFRNYSNNDVEVEFRFTQSGGFKESFSKQAARGGSTRDFAKMAASLDTITKNAVLVEAHTDVYEETERENEYLKQADVLLSAYRDGNKVVPVELLVKEYTNQTTGKLYMAVTMKKAAAEIVTGFPADGGFPTPSASAKRKGQEISALDETQDTESKRKTTSVPFNISIPDLVQNINASEGDFLKYLPDEMLTEAQKEGKKSALEQQRAKIDSYVKKGKNSIPELEPTEPAAQEPVPELLPENAVGATKAKGQTYADSQTNSIRAAAIDAGVTDPDMEADITEHMHVVRGVAEADKAAQTILRKHGTTKTAELLLNHANRAGGWNADDATLAWHTLQAMVKKLNSGSASLDKPKMVNGKDSGMTVREDLTMRMNALSAAYADQNTKAGQYLGYLGNKTKEVNASNILVMAQQILNPEPEKPGKQRKGKVPDPKTLTPQQTSELVKLAEEMEKLNRNSKAYAQKKDRVVEILAEALGPTSWSESVSSLSYVMMLSNILKTGGKNVIGNASSGALYRMKNTVVKPMLEKAMRATKLGDKTGYTYTTGKVDDALRSEAYKVYENEAYGLVNGPSKYDTTGRLNLEKSGNSLKNLGNEAKAARKKYAGKAGKLGDAVQWLADAENETYSAQDELGAIGTAELLNHLPKGSKIAQMLSGWAESRAKTGKVGLGGTQNNFVDALARAMKANGIRTAAELDADPVLKDELLQYAVSQAKEVTFHDENKLSRSMQNISRDAGVFGRAVMPFARTPANVAMRAVEYSPLGSLIAANKAKQGDADAAVDALAKSLTGTALMALGLAAGALGYLSGGSGDERKDRYEQSTKGEQDYSLNIGKLMQDIGIDAPDATISVETLSPAILPMLIGASLAK
ncbi:MAG: hypothetical protein IJ484_09410, partial [Oscillospiraceae bacterium]|nr:hypothetical protein [Oscillospiraceae bacterium]